MNSSMLTLTRGNKNIPRHQVYSGPVLQEMASYPALTLKNWLLERFSKRFEKERIVYNKRLAFHREMTTPQKKDGHNSFELFSFPDSPYDITQTESYKQADIIHLHWVEGFLDYTSFFKHNNKPIVWTLHDECPYLGGFHYAGDLERNRETHGIINEEIKKKKEHTIGNSNAPIIVVSPSEWIAVKARTSKVFAGREVKKIRNWLNHDLFKPHDKAFSRRLLGIPEDKQVFMLSAANLDIYRKGMDQIFPLLDLPELGSSLFAFVGNCLPEFDKPNVLNFGNVTDERLLPILYSSADAFILPSREDNLPNTMLEAIACETPVVAFDIGDNKDFIGNQGVVVGKFEQLVSTLIKFSELKFDFSAPRIESQPDYVIQQYQNVYGSLMKN
jgi:glycosyltransferase involved in cell wall biosynthesis